MATTIVPDVLYLGPEVAVPETVMSLRSQGKSVLVVRCMEAPPDSEEYIAALSPSSSPSADDADDESPSSSSKSEPPATAKLLHLVLRDEAEQGLTEAINTATDAVARWLEIGAESSTDGDPPDGTADSSCTKPLHPTHAVVVHCAAGVSRSASVVTALVMNFGARLCGRAVLDPALGGPQPPNPRAPVGLERALSFVASRRPVISPNEGFLTQLMDFERRVGAGGGDDASEPTFDPIQHKVRTVAGVCAVTPELARRALESAGMDINRAAEFIFTGVVTDPQS